MTNNANQEAIGVMGEAMDALKKWHSLCRRHVTEGLFPSYTMGIVERLRESISDLKKSERDIAYKINLADGLTIFMQGFISELKKKPETRTFAALFEQQVNEVIKAVEKQTNSVDTGP